MTCGARTWETFSLKAGHNQLLIVYDHLICAIFRFDFLTNLRRAPSKREYLIGRQGWLDLLGSVPTFGFFELSGLRLARLSRLARITRFIQGGRATSVPFTAVLTGPQRTTTDNAEAASTCMASHLPR